LVLIARFIYVKHGKMAHRIQRAFAYLRTSSAANVGADKDSERRQRQAIEAFAKRAGYELVAEFYDAAVSGADPIEVRDGFAAMLKTIAGNGVRTIIVETASRFARDLMVQEVGFAKPASSASSSWPPTVPMLFWMMDRRPS
jgi:phosphoglycolate phosphatase-like HAD superfamily hydrolase